MANADEAPNHVSEMAGMVLSVGWDVSHHPSAEELAGIILETLKSISNAEANAANEEEGVISEDEARRLFGPSHKHFRSEWARWAKNKDAGRVCLCMEVSTDSMDQERLGLALGKTRVDFALTRNFVLYIDNHDPGNIRRRFGLTMPEMRAKNTSICGILAEQLSADEIVEILNNPKKEVLGDYTILAV